MPRRKKRNANLGVRQKGYWKVWKKRKGDNKTTNNEKVVGFEDNVVIFETNVEKNVERNSEKNTSSNVSTNSVDNMSVSKYR